MIATSIRQRFEFDNSTLAVSGHHLVPSSDIFRNALRIFHPDFVVMRSCPKHGTCLMQVRRVNLTMLEKRDQGCWVGIG